MPLAPGTRLGPYEVVSQLGAGGMGEVYRATDSRLRRDIAIKILPAEAADPDRRARFAQEAQSVAALNHPGIVTIHSIEESGDLHFITMELVDGQALNTMTATHGMPLPRLLQIVVPLADAIGAAHSRGIIHRDLKPANVMVTRDGRVKVLDFGLAKLSHPGAATLEATTQAAPVSIEGVVMGTVAYMSPEQAQGLEIDHRSDVFSFGVLVYELAAGRRPFRGDSSVGLLAAIVKDAPTPLTDVRPDAPRELSRIIGRCLEKDPARRFQSILDVRNDLEDLKAEFESRGTTSSRIESPVRNGRQRTRWVVGAIGAFAVFAALVATAYMGGRLGAPQPPVHFTILPAPNTNLGNPNSITGEVAVSPDGRTVVFNQRTGGTFGHLWIRPLDAEPRLLLDTEGAGFPFWSPDGRYVAFFANDELRRVDVLGGQPATICKLAGTRGRGGVWLDADTIVFADLEVPGLQRVSTNGGKPTTLVPFEEGAGFLRYAYPVRLDGRRFLYLAMAADGAQSELRMSSLDAPGTSTLVMKSTRTAAYDSGTLFFAQGRHVVARRLDLVTGALSGTPVAIAPVPFDARATGNLAFSAAGRTLAWIADIDDTSQLRWLDPRGEVTQPLGLARSYGRTVTLSADGKSAAAVVSGDAWVIDAESGDGRNVAPKHHAWERGQPPMLSPDGNWLAFEAIGPSDLVNIYAADLARPGLVETIAEAPLGMNLVGWAGNRVAWRQHMQTQTKFVGAAWLSFRGVLIKAPGGGEPAYAKEQVANGGPIAVSPDGTAIAYVREVGTRRELCLDTIPASGGCAPVWSGSNITTLIWRADGNALVFKSGVEVFSVPLRRPAAGIRAEPPRFIFKQPPGTRGLAVSRDGQQFLVFVEMTPGLRAINAITHWAPPASEH